MGGAAGMDLLQREAGLCCKGSGMPTWYEIGGIERTLEVARSWLVKSLGPISSAWKQGQGVCITIVRAFARGSLRAGAWSLEHEAMSVR